MVTLIEPQFVDPAVTKNKYDRLIDDFKENINVYLRRGIFCRRIEYPKISLLFSAPHINPPSIVFAVEIDFLNYDFNPPSVKFIDPFTGQSLKIESLKCGIFQFGPNGPVNIIQGIPGEDAFLCIPGIREYHEHPAHSGDSWFLYRSRGEGTLPFIIEQIYKHSIGAIAKMNMQIEMNVAFQGYSINLEKIPR